LIYLEQGDVREFRRASNKFGGSTENRLEGEMGMGHVKVPL